MNAKIHELMTKSVITTAPDASIEQVRQLLQNHKVSAAPVVDAAGEIVGIVSATDLLSDALDPQQPVSAIMTDKVYTVPQYDDVSIAARIMRNHKIHRVVVTHEQKAVGIVSAFDLLELVENHRWTPKNPPPESRRKKSRRI